MRGAGVMYVQFLGRQGDGPVATVFQSEDGSPPPVPEEHKTFFFTAAPGTRGVKRLELATAGWGGEVEEVKAKACDI